jgi:hypothetical protein
MANEAARNIVAAVSEPYRMEAACAVSAYAANPSQELGIELIQGFVENVIGELSTQAEVIRKTA